MTTTVDLMDALKKRLQAQQRKMKKNDAYVYRAELDALWACVEVLAQAVDGKSSVIVPDYFSDPETQIVARVDLERKPG